ncbi:MAG: glycine cleavage system aminomethyltransferase GcvT [bacterium]|nr:glycine cleavage system aminomethyltransferase GcvT [bacterium]
MKTTPFYEKFKKLGAFISDFAGFKMPIYISSIKDEHFAVRNNVGMFDISHMAFFIFRHPNALERMNQVLAANLTTKKYGDAIYSLILNEKLGILDDTIVYLQSNSEISLVVNAANATKIKNWFFENFEIELERKYGAALAVQGPKSKDVLSEVLSLTDIDKLAYYTFFEKDNFILARTGYTAELGYEIYFNDQGPKHTIALETWENLMAIGVKPCGLAARDILRLEAGYPLYSHELTENITPFDAGLTWTLSKNINNQIPKKKLVGLESPDRRAIPRMDDPIFIANNKVGYITSGSYSFFLEKTIALAYLDRKVSDDFKEVEVQIRGRRIKFKIVKKSFYVNSNLRS